MDVSIARAPDRGCDEFVQGMPAAKLCHTRAWGEMVERTVGHKAFYLVARDGEVIQGVLPLMQVRSRLFGNRMVSQAFSNYGGPLADTADAADGLYSRAVDLATSRGCGSIEFRNVDPLDHDLASYEAKATMLLSLAPDPDELWGRFKPKVRNQVRKAEKSGIIAESGGLELLDDFYRVWTVRMRQLGTPCYPRKLFRSIFQSFPDNCRVFVVRLGEATLGGAFVYSFNGLVQMRWAATLVEYNSLCPNSLLYWSVMRHYCLAGASTFDFGRCTVGSGTHRFKKQWGAQQVDLHYQYWVRLAKEFSVLSPDSPKYRRKVDLWKKLPLWATRLIGPYISRSLP